jgi:hypothetical protein
MQQELEYPEDGHFGPGQTLRYIEGSRYSQIFDPHDPATALAILATPRGDSREQRILLLPGSHIVRELPGQSEPKARRNMIAFLIENDVVSEGTSSTRRPVLFPSVRRCSHCVSPTNADGWREWKVGAACPLIELRDAFDSPIGQELYFVRRSSLPDDTIEVPYHV